MGRAAVCAGGRRPAREIATREPAARSGRSRSPPVPSGPSGALHTGGAWPLGCGLARRLEARPGPAAAHRHRGLAPQATRRAPIGRGLVCVCLPWPCRRPPAPRPVPAGHAVAFLLVLLAAPLVFRAPEGPAAREARRPHFVRRRASKPARALRSLRRPPHRRRLRFWCECACSGLAAAFRVGVCGECGRIRIGCRYPDRLCASG